MSYPLPDRLMRILKLTLLLPSTLLVAACSSTQAVVIENPFPDLEPVQAVQLQQATTTPEEVRLLDVGIGVFANEYRESDSETYGDWVFSEIRDNERHYLPFLLRNILQQSNQWGAVRVLPENDPSVDLFIDATIHQSDGNRVVLEVEATDSTGRVWLQDVYADEASGNDYPDNTRLRSASQLQDEDIKEPFEDIYERIANDLLAVREAMSETELNNIKQVSSLVYAIDLSPDSFGHTLSHNEEGRLQVNSLPADNDPMLDRVAEMRRRHHLFIDTVDEYYEALYEEMEASYLVWRRYSFDQIDESAQLSEPADQRLFSSTSNALTFIQRYNRFRWSKIYEQEFLELANGFNQEIAPAILELNKSVHGLSGTMEEQYSQWRNILRQLFALEVGEA